MPTRYQTKQAQRKAQRKKDRPPPWQNPWKREAKIQKEKRICKLGSNTCCERPAKIWYWQAAHDRGENVAEMDIETQWWFECYNCGSICTCEV